MDTKDGFKVELAGVLIKPTWAGLLEGRPNEDMSRFKLQGYRPRGPWRQNCDALYIAPHPDILPRWQVEVLLESERGASTADPDYASHLVVLFFAESIDRPVPELVEPVTREIRWGEVADDYDVTNF